MAGGVIEQTAMLLMRPRIGSCASTMERMSGHLDHGLRPREERRVRRHLIRCPRCRAMFESLVRTVEQMRAVGRHELIQPTASVDRMVLDRIRRELR